MFEGPPRSRDRLIACSSTTVSTKSVTSMKIFATGSNDIIDIYGEPWVNICHSLEKLNQRVQARRK